MRKIAVFACNDDCEEYEGKLPDMLAEELKEDEEFEILKFSSENLEEMILQAKDEAYKVVIVIDAVAGINPTFSWIGRMLFQNRIRPIVLVTNFDSPEANVNEAENALGNIWAMEDSSLSLSECHFLTAYFSYNTRKTYENRLKGNPGKGLSRCIYSRYSC